MERTTDRVTPFPRRRGLAPDAGLLTRRFVLGPPSQGALGIPVARGSVGDYSGGAVRWAIE